MSDIYRPILAKALFPAFESLRGRPTVPLLRHVQETERASLEDLRGIQVGFLRRLIRHAQAHTVHFRRLLDERHLEYTDFNSVEDLSALPLLDRKTMMASIDERRADAPPYATITKHTSGSSGEPAIIHYNAESRHWRDAMRLRGYGWAGYEIGMRTLHYWGSGLDVASWKKRQKIRLNHLFKRDLFIDCVPRGDDDFRAAIAQMLRFKPQVIVAYASGVAALARFINEHRLVAWDRIPVLTGAEALTPDDRKAIETAFGPAFETYGCREVMLIGAECEAHDGLHVSMENMIVEIVIRDGKGNVRAAHPGETGEVAVTDLHNLACPIIRYLTGDMAVARAGSSCTCGRNLAKIGPIEGRVTDTLLDAEGRPVHGMVFNIVFCTNCNGVKNFLIHQRADRSITFKVVPSSGGVLPDLTTKLLRDQAEKYLPGVPFSIEIVNDIPLTAAGKRRVVVVEKSA